MSKSKNLRYLISGVIIGSLLFGGISYAASEAVKLDAYFGVKIIQNGLDRTPSENKPMIVNGSTYVPLRAAAELLGVEVSWDDNNNAVILGEKKQVGIPLGAPNSLESIEKNGRKSSLVQPAVSSNKEMIIGGKSYGKSGLILTSTQASSLHWPSSIMKYNLNDQYKKLILSVGFDDNSFDDQSARTIVFKNQDGKVLESVAVGKGVIKENLEVDLSGAIQLIIEVDGDSSYNGETRASVDFISPVLIQ